MCWLTTSAYAQATYTLPQLIELAQEQHPRIRAAREGVNAAGAAVETARALPNPEFEVLRGSQRARLPGAPEGAVSTVALTQRLDLPPQRAARIGAASAGLDAEQAQLRLSRQELIRAVKLHYHELLRRVAESDAAQQDLDLLNDIRDRVKLKVSTGESPRYDAIKAEAEALNAQKAAQSAQLRVELRARR